MSVPIAAPTMPTRGIKTTSSIAFTASVASVIGMRLPASPR
jgi:hypothetical protein